MRDLWWSILREQISCFFHSNSMPTLLLQETGNQFFVTSPWKKCVSVEKHLYDQVINFGWKWERESKGSAMRISVGSRIGSAISVNANEFTERTNKERLRSRSHDATHFLMHFKSSPLLSLRVSRRSIENSRYKAIQDMWSGNACPSWHGTPTVRWWLTPKWTKACVWCCSEGISL